MLSTSTDQKNAKKYTRGYIVYLFVNWFAWTINAPKYRKNMKQWAFEIHDSLLYLYSISFFTGSELNIVISLTLLRLMWKSMESLDPISKLKRKFILHNVIGFSSILFGALEMAFQLIIFLRSSIGSSSSLELNRNCGESLMYPNPRTPFNLTISKEASKKFLRFSGEYSITWQSSECEIFLSRFLSLMN